MKVLYFVFFLLGNVTCLKKIETDLILKYLKENDVKYCFFLVTWKNSDKVKFNKIMMNDIMDIRTAFLPPKKSSISKVISTDHSKVSYILDLACGEAFAILKEGSESYTFSYSNSWLILARYDTPIGDVKSLFDTIKLRLDMNVKVAIPKNNETQYDIYEVYDFGLEVDYKFDKLGYFKDGFFSYNSEEKMFFQSRKNMTGALIRIGNLVNFTDELLRKNRNLANYQVIGGFFVLYNHHVFLLLAELLNFRYNVTVDSPRFGPACNGVDSGLGKLLFNEAIDMHVAGGVITVCRSPHIDPVVIPYVNVKSAFIYKSPGIKKFGAQVLKPLEPEVWYFALVIIVITGAIIKAAFWLENKLFNNSEIHNFFTSFMTVVCVLTQQGSATFPQHLGGRIIFLNMLIFSFWLYNYYTSGLVSSLLNSKPQMLDTFQDLYESSLEVGLENFDYINLFAIINDPYLEKLYKEKIYGRHRSGSPKICPAQDGLEKVRRGGFAYHTETYTAYPIVSRTFNQKDICNLGDIEAVNFIGAMFVKKKSQYKELFVIGDIKLWENGFSKLLYNRIIPKRSKCRLNSLLMTVGPQELFLIYLIFISGILLAIVILFAEILHHKFQRKNSAHLSRSIH